MENRNIFDESVIECLRTNRCCNNCRAKVNYVLKSSSKIFYKFKIIKSNPSITVIYPSKEINA